MEEEEKSAVLSDDAGEKKHEKDLMKHWISKSSVQKVVRIIKTLFSEDDIE